MDDNPPAPRHAGAFVTVNLPGGDLDGLASLEAVRNTPPAHLSGVGIQRGGVVDRVPAVRLDEPRPDVRGRHWVPFTRHGCPRTGCPTVPAPRCGP